MLVTSDGNGPHSPLLVPLAGSIRVSDARPLARTRDLPSAANATVGDSPARSYLDTTLRVPTPQTTTTPPRPGGMTPAARRVPSSEKTSDRTAAVVAAAFAGCWARAWPAVRAARPISGANRVMGYSFGGFSTAARS